jgi:hypothetical protein
LNLVFHFFQNRFSFVKSSRRQRSRVLPEQVPAATAAAATTATNVGHPDALQCNRLDRRADGGLGQVGGRGRGAVAALDFDVQRPQRLGEGVCPVVSPGVYFYIRTFFCPRIFFVKCRESLSGDRNDTVFWL